jgi:hypothetical protein
VAEALNSSTAGKSYIQNTTKIQHGSQIGLEDTTKTAVDRMLLQEEYEGTLRKKAFTKAFTNEFEPDKPSNEEKSGFKPKPK